MDEILILLSKEEEIKRKLKEVGRSLITLIESPVVDVLKSHEQNHPDLPELKIEKIVSETNKQKYNFDNKMITSVLNSLMRKGQVEFNQDYTYRLNKNFRKNY